MAQRDIVLRWIEQLARLVARLLGKGLPGDLATAREQVDDAVVSLLGPLAPTLPHLEAESAADLLQDPERVFAYARLLDLDAAILQASGDHLAAGERRSRAVLLAQEAVARSPDARAEWVDWLAARAGAGVPGGADAAER